MSRFVLNLTDTIVREDQKIQQLGNLMNDSHFNNASMQDVTNAYVDELTEMAREKGAISSKLVTGNYCVSVVQKDKVAEFLSKMQEYYIKKRPWSRQLKEAVKAEECSKYQFVVKPTNGASIIEFSEDSLVQKATKVVSSEEPKSHWGTLYDVALGLMYAYLVHQLIQLFFKFTDAEKPISEAFNQFET